MRDTDLFQLALGLQSTWRVTRIEFAVEDSRLDLYLDFPRGSRFACAECGRCDRSCPSVQGGFALSPKMLMHSMKELVRGAADGH